MVGPSGDEGGAEAIPPPYPLLIGNIVDVVSYPLVESAQTAPLTKVANQIGSTPLKRVTG